MNSITHLLDTSVYSQRLRPKPSLAVVDRWRGLGDHRLAISSICEAELLYGLEKRDSQRLWREYFAALKDRLVVLPIDHAVAKIFSKIKSQMESFGEPRADFDLLIAASCLKHGLILATGNVRHFDGIPGLLVEDWFDS